MNTFLTTLLLVLVSVVSKELPGEEKSCICLDSHAVLELRAKKIAAATRQYSYGICLYDNQLWDYTMSNPPERILVEGHINIDGQKIKLDVSGLATPWIHPQELTIDDCRLTKHHFCEEDCYYILEVAFIKGGALDYMVTWIIYKNKSLRIKIEDLDDVRPSWLVSR